MSKLCILAVSDIHLTATSKWSDKACKVNEDFEFLMSQLEGQYKEALMLPDIIIDAGDTTHRRRVDDEEIDQLTRLFKALNPRGVPIATINGNHNKGDKSFTQSCFPDVTRYLEECSFKTREGIEITGMNNTSNLDVVRDFLKTTTGDIVVIHQSSEPFFTYGNTLKVEDYPDNKVCIVGDTHVCASYIKDNKFIISPGMLFPNRKNELLAKDHCALVFIEYDTVTKKAAIIDAPLRKRPAVVVEGEVNLEEVSKLIESGVPRPVLYVTKEALANVPDDFDIHSKFVIALYNKVSDVVLNKIQSLKDDPIEEALELLEQILPELSDDPVIRENSLVVAKHLLSMSDETLKHDKGAILKFFDELKS